MSPKFALVVLFFLLHHLSFSQGPLAKVKIYPPQDRVERARLLGALEIDHFMPDADGAIVAELPATLLPRLSSSPYRYQVLIPDMSVWLQQENEKYYASLKNNTASRAAYNQQGKTLSTIIPTPDAFEVKSTFGGYYSFAQMELEMDSLVASFPAIASKTSIGTTHEGRNIWCIKISDNVASDDVGEPQVLYLGLQHAREAITGSSMIFFMQYICENYGVDPRITQLVNNREFYIIPCFNPDGWEYNRNNGGVGSSWRKNRFPNATGTFGVDLNRNWGVDWGDCNAPIMGDPTSCGSSTTSTDTYWGTAPFSEKETQAVRAFAKTKRFVAGFDQHAYGPYYSLPFGRKSRHTMPVKGTQFYTAVPALMGMYNGMRAADSYDALGYEVAGGFKDWMLMGEIGVGTKDTVWAMTGEGGAGGGISGNNFWAPAAAIENLCKGMCFQNLQLAFAAGTYVDIQDENDMALMTTTGNLKFGVKRIGLGNGAVTVTAIPLENIQSVGSAVTISNMEYYGSVSGTVSYTLSPTIQSGQRIRYIWQVSAGGLTYTDTIVKFYNPTVLLNDNMEGNFATNWVNNAPKNSASGFGYNYNDINFVFTASGGYKSTKALSESAAGTNYTTRSLGICQYDGTLDLSGGTAAYLTFWTRYRAENFRDKLQVQVSLNGTTWTPIRGNLTIEEPGTTDGSTLDGKPALTGILDYWSQATYDLSAYLGNNAVRFRFVFTSDHDPSSFKFEMDDGFYIDDVKVYKSSASFVVLPVTFLGVEAALQSNGEVRVNWQAQTDAAHDHFEVEHSINGMDFISLGRGTSTAPYYLLHQQPARGVNYYRIRAVNKDGSVQYSKVVSVIVKNMIEVKAYPNPVSDLLQVRVSGGAEPLQAEVVDMQGRVLYTGQKGPGQQSFTIPVQGWEPQMYLLRVINTAREILYTTKFFKH